MKPKNLTQRLGIWAIIVAGILTIPYITNAPWTTFDFTLAGMILYIMAVFYELATRNMKSLKSRLFVAAGVLIMIVLILGWAATGSD